jgi:hypothetical protein
VTALQPASVDTDAWLARRLWPHERLRADHAAYARGDRAPDVVEGEREYQRRSKAARRPPVARAETLRDVLRAGGTLPNGDPRHGTENGYTNGWCRCAPCRDACRKARRERSRARGEARR